MPVPPAVRRLRTPTILLTAILVLLSAAALGAGASGPDGRVRGFVTDFLSGAPIAGALVRIEASDVPWVFETTTDPAGSFDVVVPPHRYDLSATGEAHVQNRTAIAVGSGETTWANLTLTPAGSRTARLHGYVTDGASGAPVTTGRIVARPPWWSWTGHYVNGSALNASGYYAMDLVPDTYEIATEGVLGYDPYLDYPVSLGAGTVVRYDIVLDADPVGAWINGTVSDADTSDLIAGAEVTARVDGLLLPAVTSDVNGSYSLPVPSGDVELVADAPGYAPMWASAWVWTGGEYREDFSLAPLAYAIRGYVRDGVSGGPLPGTLVTVDPIFSDGYFDEAVSDASGYYDVALPDDYFVVQARATGYTSWSGYIFSFSGPVVWANATLWPITSRVMGVLVDAQGGDPVPGLTVSAVDVRTGYSTFIAADGSGFFSLWVPPSPAISVWVYGQGIYAGNVAYVGTQPDGTTWVNITVDHLEAQILAEVADGLTGLPVAGATVTAAWYFGSDGATADGSGGATVDAPAGLSVYVTAMASGYLYRTEILTPAPGPNPLAITLYPDLPEDVRIRGYVLEEGTGTGVWSATVRATGYDGVAPYDYTDSSGYYELWTVARPQTVRATEWGYGAAEASVDPAPGETVWVNLTLPSDGFAPRAVSFAATPTTGIDESNPTALLGDVNETSLDQAYVSILALHSQSAGIGTFVPLGRIDAADVLVTRRGPDSYEVSGSWDTRTPVAILSDGTTTYEWPVIPLTTPHLGFMNGYWDNATLSTPLPGSAVFDLRDGRLLYVITTAGYVDPVAEPTSTFAPYASGLRINLATAAIVGSLLVTAPTLRLGSTRLTLAPSVPGGLYGALLELWDAGSSYGQAAVLLTTAADAVPPTADAGADIVTDEDVVVPLDGTGSTDNVGIASYSWTFTDGTARTLQGPTVTYTFATPGAYTVTLTVEDADGNADSDILTVTVRDVTPPVVSISSPAEGATLAGSARVTVTATDNVAVVRVEIFVDGVSAGNDTGAPFEISIPAAFLGIGNHTFEAVAYDAAGHSASAVRNVTMTAAPPAGPGGVDVLIVGELSLLAVVAAVAGALLLLRRRRSRTWAPPSSEPPSQVPLEAQAAEGTTGPGTDPPGPGHGSP